MEAMKLLFLFLRSLLVSRAALAAENLALRQQLAVLRPRMRRPKLRGRDRLFWVWLSRLWSGWTSALIVVKPETVLRWHRAGFRLYWRWKSRQGRAGRLKVEREIREMILWLSAENPRWGAPRILSELKMLGYGVAESTE